MVMFYFIWALVLADFEIIPIEALRGQICGGMGAGVRGRAPSKANGSGIG